MMYIKVCPSTGYWQVELEPCNKKRQNSHSLRGTLNSTSCLLTLLMLLQYLSILMECTLAGLVGGQCLIYLDDVIIFSSTFFSNHLIHCASVFDVLRIAGLKFKLHNICISYKYELRILVTLSPAKKSSQTKLKFMLIATCCYRLYH